MNNNEIKLLAEESLNSAIELIQNRLNQNDGGFAAMYLMGKPFDTMIEVLSDYISAEIMENQK